MMDRLQNTKHKLHHGSVIIVVLYYNKASELHHSLLFCINGECQKK